MSGPTQRRLRAALRSSDGMTATALAAVIRKDDVTIRQSLRAMPDAYIDRWELVPGKKSAYRAVWCVVTPPDNCPHPES